MISVEQLIESNIVPDALVRIGIRHLLAETLKEKKCVNVEAQQAALLAHVEGLRASPIAVQTRDANEQHYEVPTKFYQFALGQRLKYSSAYWASHVRNLDEAEEEMLAGYMLWLAQYPEHAARIGECAAAHIQGHHAVETVAAQYWRTLLNAAA